MENKELNNENVQNNTQPESQPNFNQIFNVESEETPAQEQQPTQVAEAQPQTPTIKAVYNGQEEVLYTIKEEREAGGFGPILLFALLIVLVFLLPYISEKVEWNVFDPEATPAERGEEGETDEFFYFKKSSVRAKIGTLELTNFVKSHEDNEYLLSFTINNVGEKSYDFSNKYYVVLYNEDKIVYRALIHSYDGLGALSATTLTIKINKNAYDNANRFKVQEIPVASYPKVKTVAVEDEYQILTCTYNQNTMKYYFIDNELMKLSEEQLEYKANNANYEKNKTIHSSDSKRYQQIKEINSVFIETDEYYRMLNDIDLGKINDVTMSKIKTYRFFKYKERVDVISFELEAQGYNCG